jgi:tetratricopeptide (TPR) repeat protein
VPSLKQHIWEELEDMPSVDPASRLQYRIFHNMLSRTTRPHSAAGMIFLFVVVAIAPGRSSIVLAQSQANESGVQKLYAEAKASEAQGDSATAIAKYEEIVKIVPRLGAAYNNLGLLYFKQGQYDRAVNVLERGLKVTPRLPSAHALLGIAYFQLNKYAEAKPHLEAALRANPADNNAALILAKDLSSLEDFNAAAIQLQRLAKRQPENQEVWYLLGKVYMKLSEQALTRMNAIDPDSVLVHEMSGQIMEGMKNYDGALVEYKKAVEMAPTQPGTHYLLGNVYYQLSAWDAAIDQFQAELRNDPSNCKAQAVIGNILLTQRREAEQALEALDKALAMCPTLTQAHADRGRALLNMNRNQEAVKELQLAARATPDVALTHFYLAQAFRATGQSQEAKAEMQLFSKLEEASHAATAKKAQEVIKNKEELH